MIYNYDLDNEKINYLYDLTLDKIIAKNKPCSLRVFTYELSSSSKIDKLKEKLKNTNIKIEKILLYINKDYIDDEQELAKIKNYNKVCEENGVNCFLLLKNGIGDYKNFTIAKNIIDEFVNKVNSMTIKDQNGKERKLSVAEKFVVVYNFAANRVYNENENFADDDMRNWIGVLASNHVICSGFASLLKMLCDRTFKKDELVCFDQGLSVYKDENKEWLGGHANNIVYIKDPLYNINHITYNDSCWDCKKGNNALPTINFFMLNPNDIFSYKLHGENTNYMFESPIFYDNNKIYIDKNQAYKYNSINFIPSSIKTADNFLCDIFNMKNLESIIKDYDLKKKIEADEEKHNQERKKFKVDCEQRLISSFKNHNLNDLAELKVPSFYPETILQQYPELKEFQDYLDNIAINNIDYDILKRFKEFKCNNQEIFDQLEKRAKDINLNIIYPLKDIIVGKYVRNKFKYKSYQTIHEKKLSEIIKNHNDELKAKYERFNRGLVVPTQLLKNGLKAVAKINGITDEKEIENFVNSSLDSREKFRKEKLGIESENENFDEEREL